MVVVGGGGCISWDLKEAVSLALLNTMDSTSLLYDHDHSLYQLVGGLGGGGGGTSVT